MKVSFECTYCGHKWEEDVWNNNSLSGRSCVKMGCRDKNLIIKNISDSKIDYYKGCPPFPVKVEEKPNTKMEERLWGYF